MATTSVRPTDRPTAPRPTCKMWHLCLSGSGLETTTTTLNSNPIQKRYRVLPRVAKICLKLMLRMKLALCVRVHAVGRSFEGVLFCVLYKYFWFSTENDREVNNALPAAPEQVTDGQNVEKRYPKGAENFANDRPRSISWWIYKILFCYVENQSEDIATTSAQTAKNHKQSFTKIRRCRCRSFPSCCFKGAQKNLGSFLHTHDNASFRSSLLT